MAASRGASPASTPILQVRTAVDGALPFAARMSRAGSRWKNLQDVVGGLARQPETENAAWTGDHFPGSVDALELHLIFPFSLSDEGRSRVQTSSTGDSFALLFGDDGHLLFKEILSTEEITSAHIGPLSEGYGRTVSTTEQRHCNAETILEMTDQRVYQLPLNLKDKHGNEYELNQVFIRKFSFNVGILRFAAMSKSAVDVQAVLDVQNGIMRLDDSKEAGRLRVVEDGVDKFDFLPRDFIEGILNEKLGEGNWHADRGTDRVFTFTLAGISGLSDEKEVKTAAYNIGQMEWNAAAGVDEAYVNDFRDNNVYTRFANPNGGLWSCFHPDGGCTLIFMDHANTLPIWGKQRMKKQKVAVFGSSRPLVAFSLIEAVVFQRMYLRSLDHRMNRLILSDKHNEANLNKLKLIHGELLKFRSKFSSTPLSTTTAGKQQFQLWGTVVGLHEMAANLLETTKDLHDYYNDIAQRASQRKLDMLAVVLGFLGVAQLLSDIFWAWNQPDEKDDKNLLVPFTVSGGLLVVAIIFLLLTRQR